MPTQPTLAALGTMGTESGGMSALEAARQGPPIPFQAPAIRASTTMEKFADMVREAYAAMAAQPVGRVSDLLGFTNLSALAQPTPPSEMLLGQAKKPGEADAAGNLATLGIKAYHGSPHDFDQFSMGKIGTGEGAQAYGPGLYFAENPDVAAAYKTLKPREWKPTPTTPIPRENWDDPIQVGIRAADLAGGRAEGIDRLARTLTAKTARPDAKELAQKAIDWLKSGEPFDKYAKPAGRTYEVAIKAHPDEFLDWDKPMSQQKRSYEELVPNDLHGFVFPNSRPKDLVDALTYKRGADAAMQELTANGIKGIKYLDQGSRSAGEGSRNYVVFDDKIVDILKKYGLAGLTTAAGIKANTND